jgi:hypothetical protein
MRPDLRRQVKKGVRPPAPRAVGPSGRTWPLRLFDVEVQLEMAAFRVSSTFLASLFNQGGVAGILGKGDRAAGQDTEDEGGHDGQGKPHGRRDADGAKFVKSGALGAGPGVDGGQQAQVVEAGNAAVEQADDR